MIDLTPYKIVFDHSPEPASILHVEKEADKSYKVSTAYANQAEADLQGESLSHIVGGICNEIFTGADYFWIEFFIGVAVEQKSKNLAAFSTKLQKYLSTRSYPISESYIVVLTEDLTHIMIQESARQDNFKYRRLFNQVQCGVTEFIVNSKGIVYLDANSAAFKILGYTSTEFWKKSVWTTEDIIAPEDIEAAKGIFSYLEDIGDETEYKYRFLRKNGEAIWVSGSLTFTQIKENERVYQNYFIDIDQQTKAENALNDERLIYQNILDETEAAVIVIDIETYKVLYGNRKALLELEREPNTYIGSLCYRYVLGENKQCNFCPIKDGIVVPREHEFELNGRIYRQVFKHIIWMGREALVEYNYDITEEKRLLHLTEENKQNLQHTVESIPSGIVVYEICEEGVIVRQANPAACDMIGCLQNEIVGMKNEQIFKSIHPDDIKYVRNTVLSLKKPGGAVTYQYRIYNPVLKKYIWLLASGKTVLYPNTHTIVYVAIHDITELVESTKKYESIYCSLPCGIIEYIFKDGKIKYTNVNAQMLQLFGCEQKELLNDKWQSVEQFSHKDSFEHFEEVFSSLHNVGEVREFEFKLRRKDNSFIWVSGTLLVEAVDEEGMHILSAVNNEDARKKAESESEAKSRFLSRMSHEIRTPINAIMGIAELQKQDIEAERINTDTVSAYVKETMNASKYLLRLVNDILDTSCIENKKLEIQQEVINAEAYLKKIKKLAEPFVNQNKISFTMERRTHCHECYIGDGVRVQQVIMNLLNNAFKFTLPGGSVKLVTEEISETGEHSILQFTVSDTGIGISEEFQKQLFMPFSQEVNDNRSPFAGTGLGLSIARELTRLMGGDLICHSVQGQGSTFIATIKVGNVVDEKQMKPDIITSMEYLDFTGIRILACEDHPLNQKIIKALLERKHCKVEIAADGVIGLDMFVKSPMGYYSMILMDIRMPNMDGLTAASEIRRLGRDDALTVPIIALSANAFDEDIQKSLAAGMNEHLAKPVDAIRLYKAIADFAHLAVETMEVKPIVLVVDDIEVNREVIIQALRHDYVVMSAENGKVAMELLNQHSDIIAVVTDIQMPEMDGVQLVRAIRSEYRFNDVAILANTQFGDCEQEQSLVSQGADDFVYKPTEPSVLASRLKNALARRKHII